MFPDIEPVDRTLDIPVLVTAAEIPAQSRLLTRQDYACLDSSEAQSDDSHLTRDSVTRESQNDELSSSTLEKLDVSTLPLPALPKRRRPRSRASPSKNLQHRQRHEDIDNANAVDTSPASCQQQPHAKPRQRADPPETQKSEISAPKNHAAAQKQKQKQQQPQPQSQHLSAFQQYVAKRRESLEASNRSFNEKLEARRMHYRVGGGSAANVTTGASSGVPTYLFGEHYEAGGGPGPGSGSGRKSLSPAANKEEIYLNKSGWVQVNTKRGGFKEDCGGGYRRQQNGGPASVLQDNGRSRATARAIPMDAHGRRSDLARYSFIYQHQQHQQHQQQQSNMGIAEPKFVGSKVEELIQRNEARLGGFSSRDPALRPGYRIIDPQLASILNERPGFLPVKSPNDLDSPITPILSPPPAFQDNSRSTRQVDRRKSSRQQAPIPLPVPLQSGEAQLSPQHLANGSVKGMVFSRSFEYDTRRPTPTNSYVETFSRSFDGNLSERPLHLGMPPLAGQRERSPNFSTLTGNSPNYLTKRESGGGSSGSLRSRDSSPKFLSPQTTTAYLNTSVKEAPPAYSMATGGGGTQAKYSPRSRHERTSERSKSHALGRSRKSQFNRMGSAGPPAAPPSSLGMGMGMGVSRFRSFDTTKSQRLNSCDSGARSDLSNDELDNEDGGLSEFLSAGSQKFPKPCSSSVSISPFKMQRQRSLTPDRNESHSSSSSLRKQRSLTPESRSLTPEERRKKGSQLSLLGSRQNSGCSGSRSNTLEARQRHEDKTPPNISRSSSSSSYSGGEPHDRLMAAGTSSTVAPGPGSGSTSHRRAMAAAHSAAKQAEHEHRIRRSRSLQLSERSPNRAHKSIVNVGAGSAQQPQQQPPQQPPGSSYQQSRVSLGVSGVFPPTIRTSPASNKILAPSAGSSGSATRPRQNETDKARSFDFDYNNFNRSGGAKAKPPRSTHTSGSGGDSGSNQNLRIERETRSFDEDYREAVLNNNNGSSGSVSVSGLRYLQPAAEAALVPVVSASTSRLRQSNSPVNASGIEYAASRSPQSSGLLVECPAPAAAKNRQPPELRNAALRP
ncbi:GL16128 [Drosophila persimilis]|uniref:GL16128 n=1 Tax=Drosophila persimilis TaxID=7234 RepID=B4H5F1_DROPE|nr:GL16128 [Drosophila persimilis]